MTTRNSSPSRHLFKGLLSILLMAFCLQSLQIEVLGQSGSKSFLSRLPVRSGDYLKVSYTFGPVLPAVGQTVQFVDTSIGSPTSWNWDFGDGSISTAQNPSHIYSTAGFRKVTLVVTNNVGFKKSVKTIMIMTEAAASFVFSPTTPGPRQPVQFADTSSGNPTSWQWDFGDGGTSTSKNPGHVFLKAGSYTVNLISNNSSGSKQVNKTITVASISVLSSSFNYAPALPTAGQTMQFTDASAGSPTSWQWDFGDGSTSTAQNPSHSFSTTGSKTVTFTVTNASGSSSTSRNITVVAALAASFIYSPVSSAVGQSVQFTDSSSGSPTSWQWNFGDGSTSTDQHPSHAFTAAGSYVVTLISANASVYSSTTQIISVTSGSTLIASFTYNPASPAPAQVMQFTDTSTGSPTSWQWNFGDGSTSMAQNPSHAFTTAGSYDVILVTSNNSGSNSLSRIITVVQASTMIAPDRLIDWSRAGVWVDGVKGIPNYPVGVTCAPPTYNVYPNQAADSRAGIQAAINACPAGRAVYLPAGTYRVGDQINLKSGVSIRGAGPGVTTILATANNVYFVAATLGQVSAIIDDPGPGPDAGNISGPIISGYNKGSYTVIVSSPLAANLSAGNIVLINQTNDPSFVTYHGSEDDCTWAGGAGYRALGETKMIASKSGTSITFTRPMYHDYKSTLEPKIIRMSTSPTVNAGIENLTFNGGGYSMDRCIRFEGAVHCWVKTVEITKQTGFGVQMFWGTIGCEVTNCYFHDPTYFGGSGGYGVVIHGNATDNYVYDNISNWAKLLVAIGSSGGTANVAAYNYSHSTNHSDPWWAMPAAATHGAHTLMNLFEGNIGPMAALDSTHGSGSHNIFFRNWLNGLWHNPALTSQMTCAQVESLNYYVTFIGNVLGYSGMTGAYETDPYVERNIINIWRRGTDPLTRSSLIRHGNYDYITNSTTWEGSIEERDIPPSLYLDSKPSWFGSLDWPAIGTDVTGYTKNTPAKLRWEIYANSGILSDLFSK